MNKFISHILLPVVVLGAAVASARSMVKGTEVAQASIPEQAVPDVSVHWLSVEGFSPSIEANGVAEATRTLKLSPQVEGRLTHISPRLVEGGRVKSGALLIKVDESSYRIALAQARAELARAQAELQLEGGRSRNASNEWQQFGTKQDDSARQLASRAPQLASAQALVALREAQVAKVQLDLERTQIRAPFNAIVQSEQVEAGQVVSRNSILCTLIASDEVWVRAPVALRGLALLSDSSDASGLPGREVEVTLNLGGGQHRQLTGTVLRLAAAVDTETRKAELLVQVKNPTSRAPLLPGTFVTLKLKATQVKAVLQVPREAWVEGERVWIVTKDSRLMRIAPKVVWTDQNAVYVDPTAFSAYLQEGQLAILKRPLLGALNGMTVNTLQPHLKASHE